MSAQNQNTSLNEYHGIYFLPLYSGDNILKYFNISNITDPIKNEITELGKKYHIAHFIKNTRKEIIIETFEAILGDINGYVENLLENNVYGCVLEKSQYSVNVWPELMLTVTNELIKLKRPET